MSCAPFDLAKLCGLLDHPGLRRNAPVAVTGFADGTQPGLLAPVTTPRYLDLARSNPNVTAVFGPEALVDRAPAHLGYVSSDRPMADFYAAHNRLVAIGRIGQVARPGRDASARLHTAAHIGENCRIGANVEIGPGAVVDNCILADGVEIGPGALIGVDGHFTRQQGAEGAFDVAHGGVLHIGARTRILAGASVQRPVFAGMGRIGEDVVIGPQALIGHGVDLGRGTVLTGGVQIAGFSQIGPDCWIGPGAIIGNRLEIGARARIEIGAVVVRDVPEDGHVSGAFATSHRANLRRQARLWAGDIP